MVTYLRMMGSVRRARAAGALNDLRRESVVIVMVDRRRPRAVPSDVSSRRGRGTALAVAGLAALLAACGPSANPASSGAPGSAPPIASATAPSTGATLPPPQTPIGPGTYRWDGFEHTILVTLGEGWDLGHNNPTFFDLFRGSDFPAVTFARFTHVYLDGTSRAQATDAAGAATTFAGRPDMTVTQPLDIQLGGLSGRQFDVTTKAAKTPLFFGQAGDFRLDPEFSTRYRILDFPGGGILVIGIHAHVADFDGALALGEPVVTTFRVEP